MNPNKNEKSAAPLRSLRVNELVSLVQAGPLAASPEGASVVFARHEPDLAQSEVRTQLHLTPDPDAGEDEGAPSDAALTRGFDDVEAPAFTPDGRHVLFLTFRPQPHEEEDEDQREDGGNKLQVFALPRAGGEARRVTDAPEGVDLYRVSGEGSEVVTFGLEARPAAERGWRRRRRERRDDPHQVGDEIPSFEIVAWPLEGGDPQRLLGGLRGVDDFDVSSDGRYLALSTNHTGRPEHNDRAEIVLHDLEAQRAFAPTCGRGGLESGPLFSRDGRHLAFLAWADPKCSFSRQELFVVDLERPDEAPRSLSAALELDVEEYVALHDGRFLVALGAGLDTRLVLIDPASGEYEELPIEGRLMTHLAAAAHAPRVALVVDDGSAPGEVAWLDLEDESVTPLTELNPEAKRWRRARRETLRWENEGFTHEGLLFLPPEGAPRLGGRTPLVVWIHGGPHWRVTRRFELYEAEAWAQAGVALFAPNYRGSSGYGQDYALAIRGDLGGADARDVLAGVERVLCEHGLDPERVALGGASYGGYLTNWLLSTTKRFRAGISMAGIFDLGQDYGASDFSSWEVHYLGGAPWEVPELYRERSPLTHAAGLEAPVLIIHGLEDDNTFVANSKALYRALLALERPVEFVIYPREGHGLFEPAHRIDAHRRAEAFVFRHLGLGPAPAVSGREVSAEGVRMQLLGVNAQRELSGVRALEGRHFVEVSLVLHAVEGGPSVLALKPAGPSADLALIDEHGDVYRPIGVPLDVQGQVALLAAPVGHLEAHADERGRPPSLALAALFELPEVGGRYTLSVTGMPPLLVDVEATPPEDEARGAEGPGGHEDEEAGRAP